jgi:hypothetical protein
MSRRQFEDHPARRRSPKNPPRFSVLHDRHDGPLAIEKHDVDGAAHEPGMDGAAMRDEEEEVVASPPAEQTGDLREDRRGDANVPEVVRAHRKTIACRNSAGVGALLVKGAVGSRYNPDPSIHGSAEVACVLMASVFWSFTQAF